METVDQLCPPTKRVHRFRSHPPWYTSEIHLARRTRRTCERRWRKAPTDDNRQQYLAQIHVVSNLIRKEKSSYYSEELSGADVKKVFHVLNSLLNRSPTVLPSDVSSSALPERFANFFEEKVIKIRSSLSSGNSATTNESTEGTVDTLMSSSSLSVFDTVDTERVNKIIRSSPNKSCLLDPLPTWLLKASINTLLPFITSIVQTSLSSGVFPAALKEAVVTPLIKKLNLDRDSLKNYRPVSNVPFLSKVIEKAALSQISDYLDESDLYVENQSAYRRGHSTETALLKVQDDILRAMDSKLVTFIVFLDLSAAFDSVDHEILLRRLTNKFGFTGSVISWLDSYLSDRSVRMKIANDFSQPRKLKFGVPQGSVVGPQLFSLYTNPIADIIERRPRIQHHSYADDVQLYISADPKDSDDVRSALVSLSLCVNDLQQWMQRNMLKLNCEKTEFLVAVSPHFSHLVSDITLPIGDADIEPSTTVRSLGVVLDSSLRMNHHVSSLSSTLHFHLSNIARIRPYLDKSACEHAVRALVTSRTDYSNSLLCNISMSNINRLQRAQNRAAKLVFRAKKHDHASPFLRQLHWLPIEKRITYKILTMTYKCIHKMAPSYLQNLLSLHQPGRHGLRSGNDPTLLSVPRSRTRFGDRSFSVSAPRLWNNLPQAIRSSPSLAIFQRSLKTFLFNS